MLHGLVLWIVIQQQYRLKRPLPLRPLSIPDVKLLIPNAEQLLVLIPDESRRKDVNIFPSNSFEMAYRLDCRNLCADFQEDIEFQFSFGFTTMLRKFAGLTKSKQTVSEKIFHFQKVTISRQIARDFLRQIPRNISFASTEDLTNAIVSRGQNDDEMMLTLLNTFTSLYSRTTIGVLVVAGLVSYRLCR